MFWEPLFDIDIVPNHWYPASYGNGMVCSRISDLRSFWCSSSAHPPPNTISSKQVSVNYLHRKSRSTVFFLVYFIFLSWNPKLAYQGFSHWTSFPNCISYLIDSIFFPTDFQSCVSMRVFHLKFAFLYLLWCLHMNSNKHLEIGKFTWALNPHCWITWA